MKDIVILDSIRTPIGKYKGKLSNYSSVELGTKVVGKLLERNQAVKSDIAQLIFGSVITAGQGQNVARQISVKSGLSVEIPAMTVNEVCGSGMKAALLARQLIALDEAEVIIAGGTENMSASPMISTDETSQPVQAFVTDGLIDAFSENLMGLTVEVIAEDNKISRLEMDGFALKSHQKALIAQKTHKFDNEILDFGEGIKDQPVRSDTSLEKLAHLRPAFKAEGQITAGNASPVNDGATALLLSSRDYAEKHKLSYLSIIKEAVEIGVEPKNMAISPIKAIKKLLEKVKMTVDDIDFFEINEAFAASSIVIERELGIDSSKVNIYGGAIALGHPLGSTGARLLGTLARQLIQEKKRYGITSLCIGGGLGLAVLLENPNFTK
ncbi:thiolase family protein [Lactococcus nasutitermitis]|uniref:acetyl-CoA C-acetyltransferase n=1 Tax=Lactococcus nasutitermitis TaxID=1652957 RepID=A0ABV9JDS4_9LACT|nr:thiolase family protein [Lactococcus nasutitermitis]